MKENFQIKNRYLAGLRRLRNVFLCQKLSKEFIETLKRINISQSSNSLIVPVQNKNMIVDLFTKEDVKSGLKILRKTLKLLNLKFKRLSFNNLISHTTQYCEISHISEKDQDLTSDDLLTQATIEPEEAILLKSMKLFLVISNLSFKKKRSSWQKWKKCCQTSKDLLSVSQVTMYKTLSRILHNSELSAISKKFYQWKYSTSAN